MVNLTWSNGAGRILGESKRTQSKLNQEWGGVVPGLARDAHVAAIQQV